MYLKLTPRWASTLLGLIALILAPIPTVLIRCVLLYVLAMELPGLFMLVQIWAVFEKKIKICTELGTRTAVRP
jgi:hypothetical protein